MSSNNILQLASSTKANPGHQEPQVSHNNPKPHITMNLQDAIEYAKNCAVQKIGASTPTRRFVVIRGVTAGTFAVACSECVDPTAIVYDVTCKVTVTPGPMA